MFTPRTDIVSALQVFDLEAGAATCLAELPGRYEAPNWTPEGLLINGQGRLWLVPFATPVPQPVDTGFAERLNNDHGPAPDGRTLAITDKTETGQSVIYTLPAAGGRPRRLSPPGSYFHAWSPDGTRIAYTARRAGRFRIATCAADGSGERLLTGAEFDHCDGPDYTPDGRWLWFNGERDGAVDLWRISPRGGIAERMTSDDAVNWFPHPSPDGRWVLYLAYAPGTQQHPPDVNVSLRIMPADGGRSRTLAQIWGGQGALNVPCWAPDSRRFAFMGYRVAPGG